MIIELVGLPGSGKTTFAKKLAEEYSCDIVTIEGRGELLRYNALFLLRHPIAFVRGSFWLISNLGASQFWYTKLMNLFFVHNAKYMKAGRYDRAIIDQGHFQNCLSLFDDVVSAEKLQRYMRILPRPDVLVFFAAPEEIRRKRLEARGYATRDDMEGEALLRWRESSEANFESLFIRRQELPLTTMTVSEGNTTEMLKECATMTLSRFVMRARMPTEKAHGVQIAKTLEALVARGAYPELWIPTRKNALTEGIFSYYGLNEIFPLRTFAVPNFFFGNNALGALSYWGDGIAFLLALLFARIDTQSAYVTRNPEVAWVLKKKGARVYFEAHLFPAKKRGVIKRLLRDVDGIITNSEGTAEEYAKIFATPIEVIRNGADLSKFMIDMPKGDARKSLDLSPEASIVLYVGSFYAWKGVPVVLSAWHEHFRDRSDMQLILVGGGEVQLRQEGGLDDYLACRNVTLVPHQSAGVIPTYLRAADMVLLPNDPISEESIRYTSPIKLFEYMAGGRPIIVSDLPALREVLSDDTAMFVLPGDADALAGAIGELVREPVRGERLAHLARKEVHRYDWSKRADRLIAFITH